MAVGRGQPVRIVGAINISPDSFFSGSVARGTRQLRQLARRLVSEGADLLDIGAVSTAPYRASAPIGAEEEEQRLVTAIRALRDEVDVPLSVDTQRAAVAAAALAVGADIVNDVSGLRDDPDMGAVAATARGVILMARETGPTRGHPLAVVERLLRECLARAESAGISPSRLVLDPGLGFFRQARLPWYDFDLALLRGLPRLAELGHPLLVGASRKSFLGHLTGRVEPADRLPGSLAAAAVAVMHGAHLIRTHDVAATVDAVRVAEAIRDAR